MKTAAAEPSTHAHNHSDYGGKAVQAQEAESMPMDRSALSSAKSSNMNSFNQSNSLSRLIHPLVQGKLSIGKPGDKYEQEADRIASQVIAFPSSSLKSTSGTETSINSKADSQESGEERQDGLQTKLRRKEKEAEEPIQTLRLVPMSGQQANRQIHQMSVQRMCAECEEEKLQKKSAGNEPGQASAGLEASLLAKVGGDSLPPQTQTMMGERIGADFSNVRVHSDNQAANMSSALNAQAFTHGNDIYFNQGKYEPGSTQGQFLIAHELTHVVQQGKAAQVSRLQEQPEEETEEEERVQAKVEGSGISLMSPRIQRFGWDSITGAAGGGWDATGGQLVDAAGKVIEMTGDLIWTLLESIAPSMVPIAKEISQKGILGFIKEKLSDAAARIFDGLSDGSDSLAPLFDTFKEMVGKAGEIVLALAKGDCQPLFIAMNQLKKTVSKIAGDAWNAVTEFFAPIGDFFSRVWASFGTPVMEWLSQTASDVSDFISGFGQQLWSLIKPVKESVGGAWSKVKETIGFGGNDGEGESEGGIVQWIKDTAASAWEIVKEELKPITEPIQEVIAKVQAVLPLTAIFNLRETIQGWLKKAEAMGQAMGDDGGNVAEEQTSLRDEILPAILMRIDSLRTGLINAGIWISETIGLLSTVVSGFIGSVAESPLLNGVAFALMWIKTAVKQIYDWEQTMVLGLFMLVSDGLGKLSIFIRPIFDVLVQVVETLKNLMGKLPDLFMGPVWWMLPACIKNPIKDFILNQILMRIPFFQQFLALGDIWAKVKGTAMTILKQVFIDGDIFGAIWTLFKAILGIFNIPPQLVTNIIIKAAQALGDIITNPIGFILNILKAVKQGFVQFFSHILKHLFGGVVGWLFGQMEDAGITPPTEFSLKAILKLIFQILGLTMEKIWKKLTDKIGQEKVDKLKDSIEYAEGAWEWIKLAVKGGPGAIWDKLKEKLRDLWGAVISGVVSWVNSVIVAQGTKWLMSLLDVSGITPTITALIAIYKAIESFFAYMKQMLEIVNSVLNGIADLAKGAISGAAGYLEAALAKTIPIIIGFLANQFGLGKLGHRLAEIIGTVQKKVDDAIDWVIQKAINTGKFFLETLKSGATAVKEGVQGAMEWWTGKEKVTLPDGEHHIVFQGDGSSAELMLNSNPQTMKKFLDHLEATLGRDEVQQLREKAAEIDELKFDKDKEKNLSMTQSRGAKIAIKMSELAGLIEGVGGLANKIPKSIITFKPKIISGTNDFESSVVGEHMLAEPLTLKAGSGSIEWEDKPAVLIPQISGSEPSYRSGKVPLWLAVNARKKPEHYIKGHLLNHHVYGPGSAENLTPITNSFNGQMEREVESQVKKVVLFNEQRIKEKKNDTALINRDPVIRYEVIVNYGGQSGCKYIPAECYLSSSWHFKLSFMKLKKDAGDGSEASHWKKDKEIYNNTLTHAVHKDFDPGLIYDPVPIVNLSTSSESDIAAIPDIGATIAKEIELVKEKNREDTSRKTVLSSYGELKHIKEINDPITLGKIYGKDINTKLELLSKHGNITLLE